MVARAPRLESALAVVCVWIDTLAPTAFSSGSSVVFTFVQH